MLTTLRRYLLAVLQDGDYANDWLTHMSRAVRGIVRYQGQRLADALGDTPQLVPLARTMVFDLTTCGDPTLPARYPTEAVRLARIMAQLYDLLIGLGYC